MKEIEKNKENDEELEVPVM